MGRQKGRRSPSSSGLRGIIPGLVSKGPVTPPSSTGEKIPDVGQSIVPSGAVVGSNEGTKIPSSKPRKLEVGEQETGAIVSPGPNRRPKVQSSSKEQPKIVFNFDSFDPQEYIIESILYYQQSAKLDAIEQSIGNRLENSSPEIQKQLKEVTFDLKEYKQLREREDILVNRIHKLARAQAQRGFIDISPALELELERDIEQVEVLRKEIKQKTKQLEAKLTEVNHTNYAQVDEETRAADSAEIKKLVDEITHRRQLVKIYEANLAYYAERNKVDPPVRIMHEVTLTTKELEKAHKALGVLEKRLSEKWSMTPDFLQHISTLDEREMDRFVKHVFSTYL